ncbi:MAG: CHAT domain-containing tetratricopeptide repeat protein [Cyanobacteria bacterium P01_A01_bin.137]
MNDANIDLSQPCLEPLNGWTNEGAYVDALLDIGGQCYRENDFESAEHLWHIALDVYTSSDDKEGQSFVLINLGLLYQELGQYSKAIDSLMQSLDLQQENFNEPEIQAQALKLLGRAYRDLGRTEESIKYYNQALQLIQLISNKNEQVSILASLGASYTALNQYKDASFYYGRGLELAHEINNTLRETSLLHGIGVLEQSQGNLEGALEYFYKSLKVSTAYGYKGYEQRILGSLCLVYRELHDYAAAVDYCETSLQLAQEVATSRDVARVLNNLGLVHFSAGNLALAEKSARAAVQIIERLFADINNDPDSQVALGDTLITYNLLQRILVAQEKYLEALIVAEDGRAKASINLMAQRFGSGVTVTDINKSLSQSDIQKVAQEQNATIVEYSLILESYLNYVGVRGSTSEIYIWVIQPSGDIDFRKVPIQSENKALQRLIFQLQDSIGIRNRGGLVLDVDPGIDQQDQLKELYGLLIEPIENLLPDDPADQVIIVPQRQLFSIPFAALQDESGRYLIEKHTLSTAPATQILQFTQQQRLSRAEQPRSASNSLILGNPTMPEVRLSPDGPTQPLSSLPGAEREAMDIALLLDTSALVGDQATETAIKQKLPDAQLIHMATHGLLEYGRPEDSGVLDIPGAIALTPDDQEDGLLTAAEISNMDLQADLVVLSACDTGQGRVTDDGVIGLSRSFMTAGVPSTVVSLWAVPDAPTAQLMTEFYRQRQGGDNKAQALRQAMITTMKSHPDPRDWAAFLLIGETE